MDSDPWKELESGLRVIAIVFVISVPLAMWKIADIVVYLARHLRWEG
jgi:hypothetical protein